MGIVQEVRDTTREQWIWYLWGRYDWRLQAGFVWSMFMMLLIGIVQS